jgi:hypothetical protein
MAWLRNERSEDPEGSWQFTQPAENAVRAPRRLTSETCGRVHSPSAISTSLDINWCAWTDFRAEIRPETPP